MFIDNIIAYFQILHPQEAPCCKQPKHEPKEKLECNEANQEKGAANKCNTAYMQESSALNNQPSKQMQQEIFVTIVKQMGMTFCGAPAGISGIIQITENQ